MKNTKLTNVSNVNKASQLTLYLNLFCVSSPLSQPCANQLVVFHDERLTRHQQQSVNIIWEFEIQLFNYQSPTFSGWKFVTTTTLILPPRSPATHAQRVEPLWCVVFI